MPLNPDDLFYPFVAIRLAGLAVEYFISRRLKLDNFDFKELRVSFFFILMNQISIFAFVGMLGWFYSAVYPYKLPGFDFGPFANFVVTLFMTEFLYYLSHRYGHAVRWGWIYHGVHHTPTRLNMSVGLRIGLTGPLALFFCFSLFAFWLGFSERLMAICIALNYLYQWFCHTELVPDSKWLDPVLNTPSNHRVHHCTHPSYRNRNFGGILMLYDHLFGTYTPEDKTIKNVYGQHEDLGSGSPVAVAFAGWVSLFKDFVRYPSPLIWLQLIVRHPGWRPRERASTTGRS